MQTVRIALVGLGGYGEIYARELLYIDPERGACLVAGIDPEPQRCRLLPEFQHQAIPIYPDLESFYRADSADLVVISAPIHLHAPLTCLALAHEAHVLCEKPMCATLQEARSMAAMEEKSGKFVAIGYQWSFSEVIQRLKRDILAGVFGRPLCLKTRVLWPRHRSYYQRNQWSGRIKSAEGEWVLDSPVHNATAHYLHNMLYLLGESRETSAQVVDIQAELYRANPIENYDTAALRCHTQQGAEILFYTAHPVAEQTNPTSRFEFEEAFVTYDPEEDIGFTAHFRNGRAMHYGIPGDEANKLWQSVEAVRTPQRLACGIPAALAQLICVNAIQRPAEQIVSFPPEYLRTREEDNGDHLVWVAGLKEAIESCYDQGLLFAESGAFPWAVAGPLVDLAHPPAFLTQS